MAPVPRRPRPRSTIAPTVHAVVEMLQAVQNAWIAVNPDAYSDQPLNRGWMNVFRRWISSGIFQAHWPAVRGEFSEGFIRFCESELNLTVQEPKFAWLKVGDAPDETGRITITFEDFIKGLEQLDREFLLEWPRVVLPEITENHLGLTEMFEHAHKHPPAPMGRPMAVLIQRGATEHEERQTSEHSPAYETPHERRPTSEPSVLWRDPRLGVIRPRGRTGRLAARCLRNAWHR